MPGPRQGYRIRRVGYALERAGSDHPNRRAEPTAAAADQERRFGQSLLAKKTLDLCINRLFAKAGVKLAPLGFICVQQIKI